MSLAEKNAGKITFEKVIYDVAKKFSAFTGEDFFRQVVAYLVDILKMDIAFIGKLIEKDIEMVKTIAVCEKGKITDNFEYTLANTPCENVMGQSIASYLKDVQNTFPKDDLLKKMDIHSYVGAPLFDSKQNPLGIIVAVHRKPLTNSTFPESILNLFATRTATEMERILMEEELKDNEKRYRTVVEHQEEFIVRWKPNGIRTFANSAYLRYFGLSPQDAIGTSIMSFIADDDRKKVRQKITRLTPENPSEMDEHQVKKADGTIAWNQWIDRAIFDGSGNLKEIQSVGRDITKQKEAEIKLKKSEEKLRQSQKLEAIGSLAGGIAHDFNNLLVAILGYGDILAEKLKDDESMCRYAVEIKNAGNRAASLTRHLLAFSRKQVLEIKVINLNTLINDMLKILSRVISENIKKDFLLDEGLGLVKADPMQIEQVILNIVVNARDAMPDGGKLTIETSNVEFDEKYIDEHPVVEKSGDYAMVSISDTGKGMDKETKERIFEPFFTTKEVGKGTGLGLSTVYGIVKQSGGYIWCYSEPGIGTTFKIYLPRTDEVKDKDIRADRSKEVFTGSETILVAEDDEKVLTILCEALKSYGYETLQAKNGDEAISLSKKEKGKIDLLISDIVLPDIKGNMLSEKIKKSNSKMKTIYMSGYTEKNIISENIIEEGAIFLQKPFNMDTLLRKVSKTLKGS